MADSDENPPSTAPQPTTTAVPPVLHDENVATEIKSAVSRPAGSEAVEVVERREREKATEREIERLRRRFGTRAGEMDAETRSDPVVRSRRRRNESYVEPLGSSTPRPTVQFLPRPSPYNGYAYEAPSSSNPARRPIHPRVVVLDDYEYEEEPIYHQHPLPRRPRAEEVHRAPPEGQIRADEENLLAHALKLEQEKLAAARIAEREALEAAAKKAEEEASWRKALEEEAMLKARIETSKELEAKIAAEVIKLREGTWAKEREELEREKKLLEAEESNLRKENALLRAEKLAIEREKRALEKASRTSTAVSEKAKLRVEWVSWKALGINSWTKGH